MKTFTYASAFAGIGGMTMGLKPLGGIGVAAWEYDPTEKRTQYAQNAHKLLHPEIPVYGDICEAVTEELADFDVFCFTPPCQAFSVAGKRGGFEDTRGTLTFEALRIAKEKKPKILFMENVKGLVNHDKGNTLEVIINAMNDIGYLVDFKVLNSKYFNVPHNRERVYLIGIREDLINQEDWVDIKGSTMMPKTKRRYLENGVKTFNFDFPDELEVNCKLEDFLESYVDKSFYLSEDKVTELVYNLRDREIDRITGIEEGEIRSIYTPDFVKKNMNGNRIGSKGGSVPSITTSHPQGIVRALPIKEATLKGYKIAEVGDSINIAFPNSKTRRGRVGKGIANTLEASGINQAVLQNIGGKLEIRKLTGVECLRLQSVPEKHIKVLNDNFNGSRLYKFAGNGLTTNVISAIGEKLIKYL